MIDTECPLCGHKGKVPPKFSGKQVKCPECCNVFNIGGPGATAGSKPGNEKIAAASANTTAGSKAGTEKISPTAGSKAGNEKVKVNGKSEEKKVVRPNSETHHGTMKVVKPSASNQGNTQKVLKNPGSNPGNAKKPAAKPAVARNSGFSSLTFDEPADSGGGRRRRRRGPSMVPLLFSLFLLVGAIIGGTVIYNQMFGSETSSTEQASTAATKEETKVKDTETTKKEELPIPTEFVDVTKGAFKHGDVSIRVTSATIAPVKLKGQEAKDAKHLVIKLEIENRGAERVDYQGWGTAEPINEMNQAVMKDSTGKAYKRLTFGAGAQVEGMILAESIQPGKMVSDVVVFEVPGESPPYIRIELPAANLNKPGKVRLEIPKSLYGAGLVAKVDPKKDPPKIDPKKPVEESVTVALLRGNLKKAKVAKDQVNFITALGEQGPAAHTATDDILPFVKTKNEVIQIEAIIALARIGPLAAKESVPILKEVLLKDDSFKVRTECAKALGKMGPQAKDAMKELLEAVKEKDEELVESAKVAIKLINLNE